VIPPTHISESLLATVSYQHHCKDKNVGQSLRRSTTKSCVMNPWGRVVLKVNWLSDDSCSLHV